MTLDRLMAARLKQQVGAHEARERRTLLKPKEATFGNNRRARRATKRLSARLQTENTQV